jgi:hypothetical protein
MTLLAEETREQEKVKALRYLNVAAGLFSSIVEFVYPTADPVRLLAE